MTWRVARSLDVLLAEVDAIAPNRSRVHDGSIGDESHQAGASDHNPNGAGVVCARDITHDPKRGADMHKVSEFLRIRRHRCLKYLIFDRRICGAWTGWRWQSYAGTNPHTVHMHVSVGRGEDGQSTGPYDDETPWGVEEAFGMDIKDKLTVPEWARDNFADLGDTISVGTALASGYSHARSTKEYVLRLERESRDRHEVLMAAITALTERLDSQSGS